MEQVTFNGMYFVATGILIGLLATIVGPMLKLTASITTLNNTMQTIIKNDNKQDETIEKHSDILGKHETRISVLEQK